MLTVMERSPRQDYCGRPDILGITTSRYLLEIEVKRSLSDFKADKLKSSRQEIRRKMIGEKFPKQFWYLVPPELCKKVEGIVPQWAGLMRGPGRREIQTVHVIKQAPVNYESERLSVKECCRLLLMINNYALAAEERYYCIHTRFSYNWSCYPNPSYEI